MELRDDLRDFMRQTAPSVAISEAEAEEALKSVEGAQVLERITEGKHFTEDHLHARND